MPDILAFTIFVLIFTIGEYVAAKTKANVDVVLFVSAYSRNNYYTAYRGYGQYD